MAGLFAPQLGDDGLGGQVEALDIEGPEIVRLAWNDVVRHVYGALLLVRFRLRGNGCIQQTAHSHAVREIDTEVVDLSGVEGLARFEADVRPDLLFLHTLAAEAHGAKFEKWAVFDFDFDNYAQV